MFSFAQYSFLSFNWLLAARVKESHLAWFRLKTPCNDVCGTLTKLVDGYVRLQQVYIQVLNKYVIKHFLAL